MEPTAVEMIPPPAPTQPWRRAVQRANSGIAATEDWLAIALFYALLCGFIVQVFARFVIRYPIPWSEEFCRHVFVWLGALGTSIGIRWGAHFVAFDLQAHLRGWPRIAVVVLVHAVMAMVAIALLVDGADFAHEGLSQLTPILDIPATTSQAAVPVSAALILWHLAYSAAFGRAEGGLENMLGLEGREA